MTSFLDQTNKDPGKGSGTKRQGTLLSRDVRSRESDDIARVKGLFSSILAEADIIHEAGKAHLRISPETILVNADGSAKLLDDGFLYTLPSDGKTVRLAGNCSEDVNLISIGIAGEVRVTEDVFLIGRVLFYMLSGRHVDYLEDIILNSKAWIRDAAKRLAVSPDDPALLNLTKIAYVCMMAYPANRYQSIGDIASDLVFGFSCWEKVLKI